MRAQAWIEEMSAGIKAIDSYHMVTTGLEGFFGASTPEMQSKNPYNGNEGTDFVRNHAVDTIDFAVAHGARHTADARKLAGV
jgi:mannan endo-1,4-beta-mannosidase